MINVDLRVYESILLFKISIFLGEAWLGCSKLKENETFYDNQSWKLVMLPNEKQTLDYKCVYMIKDDPTYVVEKIFKARLVANDFEQQKYIDYTKIFSSFAKFLTICLLCILVTLFDLFLHQMYVVTNFLHRTLDEVIYMKETENFLKGGKEHLIFWLLKSLYWSKQSPWQWNKHFDELMHMHSFIQSAYETCVYMKRVSKTCVSNTSFGFILLMLYADDMLIATKARSQIIKLSLVQFWT